MVAYIVFTVAGGLLGAFLFRVRGGLFGDWIRAHGWSGYGAQSGRMLFALPMAILAALAGRGLLCSYVLGFRGWVPFAEECPHADGMVWGGFLDSSIAAALVVPAFVVLYGLLHLGLILGWFSAADMGRDGDRSRLVEGAIMTGRGLLLTLPAGAWLWGQGFTPWFALSGLAFGVIYELGYRSPSCGPGFSTGPEIAEVYAGAWLGTALLVTVIPWG